MTGAGGRHLRKSEMERSDVKIWATSIDESEAKEPQFLDFMVATLNDSWRIALYMKVIENYEDLIANRNDHWKQQMETAHRLLSHANECDQGFKYGDDSQEAWDLLSNFLKTELTFLAEGQQEVQACLLRVWPDSDIRFELPDLLVHLHKSQVAVTERLYEVQVYLESCYRKDRETSTAA